MIVSCLSADWSVKSDKDTVEISGMNQRESISLLLQRQVSNDEEVIPGHEIASALGYPGPMRFSHQLDNPARTAKSFLPIGEMATTRDSSNPLSWQVQDCECCAGTCETMYCRWNVFLVQSWRSRLLSRSHLWWMAQAIGLVFLVLRLNSMDMCPMGLDQLTHHWILPCSTPDVIITKS